MSSLSVVSAVRARRAATTLVLVARGRQTLTVLVPVLSAMAVSALTFEAIEHGVVDPGPRALIAPLVTFLPAFRLLVPGALGLIGVTEVVGDPASASIEDLVKPVGAIVSIALGVLGGVSVCRGLAAAPPRLFRGGRR